MYKKAWCTCKVVVLLIETDCSFAVLVAVAVVVATMVTWRHTSLYWPLGYVHTIYLVQNEQQRRREKNLSCNDIELKQVAVRREDPQLSSGSLDVLSCPVVRAKNGRVSREQHILGNSWRQEPITYGLLLTSYFLLLRVLYARSGDTQQSFIRGRSAPRSNPLIPFHILFLTEKVPLSYTCI